MSATFDTSDFTPEYNPAAVTSSVPAANFDTSDFIPAPPDAKKLQNTRTSAQLSSIPSVNPNYSAIGPFDDPMALKSLESLGGGIVSGFGTVGSDINQLLTKAYNAVSPSKDKLTAPQNPFPALTQQLQQQNPVAFGAGNIAGQTVPFAAGGEAIGANSLNQNLIPFLAKNTALGAAQGAITNPNDKLNSAIIGGAVGAGAPLVPYAYNAAKNYIADSLVNPIANSIKNLGLKTLGYAERSNIPWLSKMLGQNYMSRVPGSGKAQDYIDAAEEVKNVTGDVLDDMSGGVNKNQIPGNIQNALKQAYSDAQTQKRNLYSNVDKIATQNNVSVNPENYKNTANQLLQENAAISSTSPELAYPSYFTSFLKKISNPEQSSVKSSILNSSGNPLTMDLSGSNNKTFSEASLVRSKLNDVASQAFDRGDKYILDKVGALKDSLDTDMQNSATQSNVPELMDAWNQAQNNYRENIVPFEDPTIKSYLSGKNKDNPDLIVQSFLKTGQYGQPTLLNKLLSKIPEDEQKQVGYYFLTKQLEQERLTGNPIPNVDRVSTAFGNIKRLNPDLVDKLITPQNQQKLEDISNANKIIPNVFFNPDTGQKAADVNVLNALMKYGASGGAAGYAIGGVPGAVIGGAAGAGGIPAAARLANSVMKSRKLLNLQKSAANASTNAAPITNAIINALRQQGGAQ